MACVRTWPGARWTAAWIVLLWLAAGPARAEAPDLTHLSLEQLLSLEVTTVSRAPRRLSDTAAAIAVLTAEDIRRSGATSIPEALRLVPGVNVAQISASQWAVSVRGFNGAFANKLLVLLDGRTLYSPSFSGVFWDTQDVVMEDIERIEVIRGPGAAIWGANAVNGVINIISKSARDTHGTMISTLTGTHERTMTSVRQGGRIGEVDYRIYAKYSDTRSFDQPNGDSAHDAWNMGRAGFRLDWEPSARQSVTILGDLYSGRFDQYTTLATFEEPVAQIVPGRTDASGGYLLGRWRYQTSPTSEYTAQVFYDRTRRSTELLGETRDTFDLDIHQRWTGLKGHEIVWGLGYRNTRDSYDQTDSFKVDPSSRSDQGFSLFFNNDIELIPGTLILTLGTKLEHNDYTGFEIQPSGRLAWLVDARQTLWGAVSRAVRTPSRLERDSAAILGIRAPLSPGNETSELPLPVASTPNPNLDSERLIAYELGYRVQPARGLSFDIAGFYNVYDRLITGNTQTLGSTKIVVDPNGLVNADSGNSLKGHSYGFEVVGNWQAAPWWRLQASYSFIKTKLHRDDGVTDDPVATLLEGSTPQNQVMLRSMMDLGSNVTFDGVLRYVDALPAQGISDYFGLDLRLAWRPLPNLELALIGRSLLQDHHREFGDVQVLTSAPAAIPRTVLGKITLRF